MRNLLIYGGTFDPVHLGHVNTAIQVQNYFHFDHVVFLPCKTPLLKNSSKASTNHRIAMLELALSSFNSKNQFSIDLCEIERNTPSYMVDSLLHFRQRYGDKIALVLLMGIDVFQQLPQWHNWSSLLTLANILVIKRSGYELQQNNVLKALLQKHEAIDSQAITSQPHGLIYQFNAGSYNFSSSWIREQLTQGKNVANYLPHLVLQYIQENKLYTPYN